MGRSTVRVVVRARPTAHYASENFQFNEVSAYDDRGEPADSIDMRLPKDQTAGTVNNQQESWHFKLDKVLSNASQEQVFECCAADIVRSVMDGYNGTIMAYGQTGAGKTHTMTGGHVGFADRGIVPRAISLIYAEALARPENNIAIRLSYAEIYNELIFDLLTDVGVQDQSGDFAIVEDARGCIHVRGLSMPVAATEEEALHIFFQGDTNRHVAEHALNKGSTRSHCLFTIYVESRSKVESTEKVINSKLQLVDLAGSERLKKTGTDGVMLKEATYINKSLSFLEQVVMALGNKHRDHVPYRQSKLTHMLKDSLGGNCKTTMVANVWPEANKIEESASTLRFATRMMRVANEAVRNVNLDPQLLIRKYERQIKDLKQELAMYDTLAGRSRVQYEEYTQDESKDLEAQIKLYLAGERELDVQSLRMVYESFAIFRNLYKKEQLRADVAESRPTMSGSKDDPQDGTDPDAGVKKEEEPTPKAGEVGEDEDGRGISVGIAPSSSRPAQEDRTAIGIGEQGGSTEGGRTELRGAPQPGSGEDERPPDKQVVFSEWKLREGAQFSEDFEKNRIELRKCKEAMKEEKENANEMKREIDDVKEQLAMRQANKEPDNGRDEDIVDIDEEHFRLIKTLKEAKEKYKQAVDRHHEHRDAVMHLEKLMTKCKTTLVNSFEDWYEQRYGHLQKQAEVAATRAAEGERYDPQETFDMMQAERFETHHPDALAYHKARKNAARAVRHKGTGTMSRVGR